MRRSCGGWELRLRLISRRWRVNVVGNDIAQAEICLALSASSLDMTMRTEDKDKGNRPGGC
jgi:hypothetical protein